MSLAKFSGPDLDSSVEFTHPDIWRREEDPEWARLVIGARKDEIPLILDLCRDVDGPFGILYVLLVSRRGRPSGRYQSPEPVDFAGLESFLYTFQNFFEQDGRHHLWVASSVGEGQFIYDRHNMIYAYGDLARYEARLRACDFEPGDVRIPAPHCHNYHGDFDAVEDDVMNHWAWKQFPLQPEDEV